jgi:hypothetical protein
LLGDVLFLAPENLQNPWVKGVLCNIFVDQNIHVVKEIATKKVRNLLRNQLAYKHPPINHLTKVGEVFIISNSKINLNPIYSSHTSEFL